MIPDGFEKHFRQSPLTEPWEPLYSRRMDEAIYIGLNADQQHCNARGFVHGGLISAIADNAMGLSCSLHHENLAGLVTISLNMNFTGKAQIGDWIEFQTRYIKPGRSVDTAQGQVLAGGKVCALMSATFKVQTR